MQYLNLVIGILILLLGIPLGNLLAKITKEELKPGKRWFKLITILSLIGALTGLFVGNDVLLFSFAFMAIVTSRSVS